MSALHQNDHIVSRGQATCLSQRIRPRGRSRLSEKSTKFGKVRSNQVNLAVATVLKAVEARSGRDMQDIGQVETVPTHPVGGVGVR